MSRRSPGDSDGSSMLFEPSDLFRGLPVEGFEVFELPDRDARRRAIVSTFHPPLEVLGDDLIAHLGPHTRHPLHAHLPRLDWPRTYEPFCTWLALSHESHGYQARGQLNLGVHRDYVAARLGWDTRQASFGRFEFLCHHAGLGAELTEVAAGEGLAFRVYASARWPEGSRLVFESPADWREAFQVTQLRGVWFEVGARFDLPESADLIGSAELGREAARIFGALLPVYERL